MERAQIWKRWWHLMCHEGDGSAKALLPSRSVTFGGTNPGVSDTPRPPGNREIRCIFSPGMLSRQTAGCW